MPHNNVGFVVDERGYVPIQCSEAYIATVIREFGEKPRVSCVLRVVYEQDDIGALIVDIKKHLREWGSSQSGRSAKLLAEICGSGFNWGDAMQYIDVIKQTPGIDQIEFIAADGEVFTVDHDEVLV